MSKLVSQGLIAGYAERDVIKGLDLSIEEGELVALVGPNGSGKSTLLRALGRLLKPRGGVVLLDGKALNTWSTRNIAQKLALLPQGPVLSEDMTVEELVWMGRSPHQSLLGLPSASDHRAVALAISETDVGSLVSRKVSTLSGGERQRAWLALALAQEPQVLLLDEPTTFLDLSHQLEVLDLVNSLNRERAITVVMVLHDLNQAARYARRVVVLKAGEVFEQGTPAEVLTARTLREVFAIEGRVLPGPEGLELIIVPLHRTI